MSSSKVWLITGAASGFGRAATEHILKNGDKVFATDLKPESLKTLQYPSDQLIVFKMDVSNPGDIAAAFAKAKEHFGRLDVVYSNAGYLVSGDLESTPVDAARKMTDVIYWGSAQVSLEAVKFFREVNGPAIGGRLLITTSVAGLCKVPCHGYYSAGKHALEGFADTLAAELDPAWNIKITMIEPGAFRTGITGAARKFPPHPAYADNPNLTPYRMENLPPDEELPTWFGNTAKAAVQIFKLSRFPDPPLWLPLGKDSISDIKKHLTSRLAEVENFESWSDDVNDEQ